MSPLDVKKIGSLLIQSLKARPGMGSDDASRAYLEESRFFFLEEWARVSPGVTAIDGESILVLALQASPAAAMKWTKLAGNAAWDPTERHPHPLVDMFPESWRRQWGENSMPWTLTQRNEKDALARLVQEGMRLAMPARMIQKSISSEDLQAQQDLCNFCSTDCSLFSAREKAEWLLKHEGALVMEARNVCLWIDQDLAGPNDPVWVERKAGSSDGTGSHALTTVLDAYIEGVAGFDNKTVLEWLERRGEPQETLNKVHAAELSHAAKHTHSWKFLKNLIQSFEGGWHLQECEDSPLVWQSVLTRHPIALKDMVHQLDSKTLRMQSSNGMGIWDCLAMAMASKEKIKAWPLMEDILYLHHKAPFSLSPKGTGYPVVFKALHFPDWQEDWLKESIGKDPQAWLGPLESQAHSAAQLLWALQVGENVSNAEQRETVAKQLRLLHQAWKVAPEHVSTAAVTVLHGVQHYLSQVDLPVKDLLWDLSKESFPEPEAESLQWVRPLLDEIQSSKRKPRASRQALERTLTWLHMHTFPRPESKRRLPRF